MQYKTTIVLLAVILFLTACASTGSNIPDWVNGKSSDYPINKYLLGKGQDTHQSVARDRARADLAKIFEVAITEQSNDETSYKSSIVNQKQSTQLDTSTSRQITSRTEKIISGIEIAEIWQDKKSDQFHILAILNRMKAANSQREQINKLDDKTAQAIRRARQMRDPLEKLGLASIALQSQIEREAYQKQLKIIEYSGMGLSSPYNLTTLLNDRNSLLKRLKIQTILKYNAEDLNNPITGLNDTIKGAVATVGFTNINNNTADYILNVSLQIDKNKDSQGWYWQKGILEINLQEQATKKIRGSKQWRIKESSQNEKMSAKRVHDKIDHLLKTQLRETLVGFGTAN